MGLFSRQNKKAAVVRARPNAVTPGMAEHFSPAADAASGALGGQGHGAKQQHPGSQNLQRSVPPVVAGSLPGSSAAALGKNNSGGTARSAKARVTRKAGVVLPLRSDNVDIPAAYKVWRDADE